MTKLPIALNPAARSAVEPFYAMEIMREAQRLEQTGKNIIHMEVGQPGASAPKAVLETTKKALVDGQLKYTEAKGRIELREKIAEYYLNFHGISVSPERIIVTTGSSAGFNLAFLSCFNVGDRIAISTPGYPPYHNIMSALGLQTVKIQATANSGWALELDSIEELHCQQKLSGVLIASPANPSGTMQSRESLQKICEYCDNHGIWLISDEIYHRLDFKEKAETALELSNHAVVINSFSKYYCMTGWRIGWMVIPEILLHPIERLAQNFYISAPDLSQQAAISAFDATEELEEVKSDYSENRIMLLEQLAQIGFSEILPPDGAFYIYANVNNFSNNSLEFTKSMLLEAGVAVTPGIDFDSERGKNFVRFSYAGLVTEMHEAIARLKNWLG